MFTGILAFFGSLAGGGGNVAGTFVALILNPIGWLAIWFWVKSTKISCPHCGMGMDITASVQTQAVGSLCRCVQCRNEFRKPALGGESVSISSPRPTQPFAPSVAPILHDTQPHSQSEIRRGSVEVVEPQRNDPEPTTPLTRTGDSESMLPSVLPREDASECSTAMIPLREPEPDPVIMRVDGTSSFTTLKEHRRRGWRDIARCDLSNMNFRGESFAGVNFEGTKLDGTDFAGCDFKRSIFSNVSAQNCSFEGADFSGAKLSNSVFQGSNLGLVRFYSQTGDLVVASFDQVNFSDCNLSHALFIRLPANGPRLGKFCQIERTNFSGSDMSGCDLRGSDLRTCSFSGTNLFATNLMQCNLAGVDLANAGLINANLCEVIVSNSTRFPEGFPFPLHGKNVDVVLPTRAMRAEESNGTFWTVAAFLLVGVISVILVVNSKSGSELKQVRHVSDLATGTKTKTPSFQANVQPSTATSDESNRISLPAAKLRLERPQKSVSVSGAFSAWKLSHKSRLPTVHDGIESYSEVIVDIQLPPSIDVLPESDLSVELLFPSNLFFSRPTANSYMVVDGPTESRYFTYPFTYGGGIDEVRNSTPLKVTEGGVQIHIRVPAKRRGNYRQSFDVNVKIRSSSLKEEAVLTVKNL